MPWKDIKINSWSELFSFIESLTDIKNDSEDWHFRGQADSKWPLHSSLYRRIKGVNLERALGIEFGAYRRFHESYHLYTENDGVNRTDWNIFAWWMVMQHHSCPTRLLDWSLSPFIATYFAVEHLLENDAAIWIFPSSQLDSYVTEKHGRINPNNIELENSEAIYPILAAQHSRRSSSQKGVYTVANYVLADHGDLISKAFAHIQKPPLYKLIIPSCLKQEFLARLHAMNITPSSIYPDLDGLGKTSRDYIVIRKWRTDINLKAKSE